jgi:hypothetical protein
MALLQIPLPVDSPSYTLRVTLDGTEYVIRIDYSQRQDRYVLSLYDLLSVPIFLGRKVVCGVPIGRQCVDFRAPPGPLIFCDPKGPTEPAPGFSELGRRVGLFYLEAGPSALPRGPAPSL